MRKRNLMGTMGTALCMAACVGILMACGSGPAENQTSAPAASAAVESQIEAQMGIIYLKVNPEIAVHYDENGAVTKIEGVNDDGKALIENVQDYSGKECGDVIRNLVVHMNEAGYFTEELEGDGRRIILEIEKGSVMPDDDFIGNIVAEINSYLASASLEGSISLEGASDYTDQSVNDDGNTDYGPGNDGITDYADTDYGPDNDGNTDYLSTTPITTQTPATATPASGSGTTDYDDTDYGPNNDGVTDYNDTDYGPNNDGVTDYDDTDYGPNNDGVTDYNDTDYGPNNDGVTDYNDTDYGPNNDGVTDYDDTDYGPNNDGVTDYTPSTPAPTQPPAATQPPASGNSDYDDGNSDYDDGNSNYDDGGSDYDDD